jgi:hypothetical protein
MGDVDLDEGPLGIILSYIPAEGEPRELDRVLAGRVSLGHYTTSSLRRGRYGRGEAEADPAR